MIIRLSSINGAINRTQPHSTWPNTNSPQTQSPHRFLQTADKHTSPPGPSAKPSKHTTPSQFATAPRFAGPKSPTKHQPTRSPKPRKDRVEDFTGSVITTRENAPSPTTSAKRLRIRERIDDAEDAEDAERISQALRKRRIPLEREGDSDSNGISPFLADSTEQPLASPRPSSSTSPHTSRAIPRFDFSKLTERTTSKLQKVTGTGHFIFDSTAGASQGETLSLEHTNLTLLFSPQKYRKCQYAPGGLAATVRDWVLDAAAGIGGDRVAVSKVERVEFGERGERMVCGVDKGLEVRFLLLGESGGLRDGNVVVGCWVEVMEPCWEVVVDEVWTVAVNWKVIEVGDVGIAA